VFNLAGVLLVDIGLASIVLGAVSILKPLRILGIHSREAGMLLCLAAAGAVVAAMLLPAPVERAADLRSDLDRAMPAWQFRERHRAHVNASPEAVDRAIRAVSADDILLFRTLTWIRSPRFREADEGNILSPPSGPVPLLGVVLRSGFITVSDRPARELVLGTVVARPVKTPRGDRTPESFIPPRRARIRQGDLEFRDRAGPGGRERGHDRDARLRHRSRRGTAVRGVLACDLPGSSLIRYMWLRAIGHRAEGG
jgi:hypothetical protein